MTYHGLQRVGADGLPGERPLEQTDRVLFEEFQTLECFEPLQQYVQFIGQGRTLQTQRFEPGQSLRAG